VRHATGHGKHVQRIVDAALTPDLEVHVIVRGAARAPDAGDALSGGDPVADLHEILVVVCVHGGEAVLVLDLEDTPIARLDARHHDHARGRRLDRLTVRGADVDAAVPPAAPPSEG
jgi:hypothetical protein